MPHRSTRPATGVVIASSIFIASMLATCSPAAASVDFTASSRTVTTRI